MHILPLSAKEVEERLSKIPVIKEEIVDQEYNANSENAQSGKAVAAAIASLDIGEKLVVDHIYSPISENPQSGKAVEEAIAAIPKITIDQDYDSESPNAQSGTAVEEAINNKTIYTNSEPLLNDVGGIKASAHTEGFNNVPISDLITELLYPYTAPVINSFTLNPTASVKKKGVPVTLTSASVKVTKKSKAISSLDLYRGTALLKSVRGNSVTSTGTTITFSDINDTLDGNTDTTYTVKVSEENGTQNVVTKSATYTFVSPYYYGVINKDSEITEALVTGLSEKVESKGSKTLSYTTTTEQCSVLAYPASYGNLASIKDPNGFTQTWAKYEILINNVAYLVYVSGAAAATDCKYVFSY